MSDSEAWLELCDIYLHEHEYDKAAFCMEELLLCKPYNHLVHQKYAEVTVSCYYHCWFNESLSDDTISCVLLLFNSFSARHYHNLFTASKNRKLLSIAASVRQMCFQWKLKMCVITDYPRNGNIAGDVFQIGMLCSWRIVFDVVWSLYVAWLVLIYY